MSQTNCKRLVRCNGYVSSSSGSSKANKSNSLQQGETARVRFLKFPQLVDMPKILREEEEERGLWSSRREEELWSTREREGEDGVEEGGREYVPVRQQIGMRTVCYRAVPSIGIVFVSLPSEIDRAILAEGEGTRERRRRRKWRTWRSDISFPQQFRFVATLPRWTPQMKCRLLLVRGDEASMSSTTSHPCGEKKPWRCHRGFMGKRNEATCGAVLKTSALQGSYDEGGKRGGDCNKGGKREEKGGGG
ncbi:hypothetical protein MUK42_29373 [Musa troglodytarum]|uniref:Uncharacterized protein n=1 Tax=Musa troglodytarum TaxID=320322 RepID=A0A9E7JMB2_9LILI|nr:hypothetical protein MUK42_29373 [Musa troglodytarum]